MTDVLLGNQQRKNAWSVLILEVFSYPFLIFLCYIYIYPNGYSQRADFWNEACKLADLHHPNVVAFYGVVLDGPGGTFATVTEFMINGSLRRALQKNDKLVSFAYHILMLTL